jgi:hypothetical protein
MKIPEKIKAEVRQVIESYNQGRSNKYVARFHTTKGFLFLDRSDNGQPPTKICRLKYRGRIDNWGFAIYRYSIRDYSPDECFFPGEEHVDGTVLGAMKAGDAAYWM